MLSRRQLFLGAASAGLLARSGLAGASSPPKKLLFVYAHGGWDTVYHLDPKLGSPVVVGPEADATGRGDDVERVEIVGGHRLALNQYRRPNLERFFRAWGDQVLTVLGCTIGGIAHYPNRMRLLTGGTDRSQPDLVARVGGLAGLDVPLGAIDLSGWSFHGKQGAAVGRAGARWQLGQLLSVDRAGEGMRRGAVPSEDALVEAYLRGRASAWSTANSAAQWPIDLQASLDRLERLRARRVELAALLDGGQPLDPDSNLSLAVDLLNRGFTRAALVDTRYYFDTHDDIESQNGLSNNLFGSLHTMLQQLADGGGLDDTLVLVGSEMTRTPGRNIYGGKDHWPVLAWMLIGGGVRGGRAIGATDDSLVPLTMDVAAGELWEGGDYLGYDQVLAGVLAQLDIDPSSHFPGVTPLGGLA